MEAKRSTLPLVEKEMLHAKNTFQSSHETKKLQPGSKGERKRQSQLVLLYLSCSLLFDTVAPRWVVMRFSLRRKLVFPPVRKDNV